MGPTAASGYAPVNGVEVYWESRGSGGTPLIVTHGGYGLAIYVRRPGRQACRGPPGRRY